MLDDRILKEAETGMKGLKVQDARIGLGYTAILNSGGGLGLAYTFRKSLPDRCCIYKNAGTLIGKDLADVAGLFAGGGDLIHSALGLAAINSVTPKDTGQGQEGDVMKGLSLAGDDVVLMIGHFAPIEQEIRKITPHLHIFDDGLDRKPSGGGLDIESAMEGCTVAVITATSLINKTLDGIIEKTKKATRRVLLGPSTPLFRSAFRGEGIHMLSGMVCEDAPRILEIVSQGGGTMQIKRFARKVNLTVEG